MSTILLITCSTRGHASESNRLARAIVDQLLRRDPATRVTNRALGDAPLPHVDANYALAQHSAIAQVRADGSVGRSDVLIQELERADTVVLATPMHNLGPPSVLKAWIDHVVRARRTFTLTPHGKAGTLRDCPVFIAVAAGGRFSGDEARQPDFLTPYLRVILGMIGLHDLTLFSVQGTGAPPDAVAVERARAAQAVEAHFSAPRD